MRLLACAVVFAIGCSGNAEQRVVASSAPVAQRPPVAALQTRDKTIRIYGDSGALRVTVVDDRGQLVADRVTLDELRTIDPFLYQACTNAVGANGVIDARLYQEDVTPRDVVPALPAR